MSHLARYTLPALDSGFEWRCSDTLPPIPIRIPSLDKIQGEARITLPKATAHTVPAAFLALPHPRTLKTLDLLEHQSHLLEEWMTSVDALRKLDASSTDATIKAMKRRLVLLNERAAAIDAQRKSEDVMDDPCMCSSDRSTGDLVAHSVQQLKRERHP